MKQKYALLIYLMIFFFVTTALAEVIGTGMISGQLRLKDGVPMSGGLIVLFNSLSGPPPDTVRYMRVPDEIGELDNEGRFNISLPVGSYYMGAIKRVSGETVGPPQDGDYFFVSHDDKNNPRMYHIEKDKDLNIGVISEAVPFKRSIPEDATGISGMIRDLNSEPVEGAIVFAYITETMTGIPLFTSYRTGKDGKYFITMDKGGKYYLRVRDVYGGGPPVTGAIMGGYGEEKPVAVLVKDGEVTKEKDIKVTRHFEMGPKGQYEGNASEQEIQLQIKENIEENSKLKK